MINTSKLHIIDVLCSLCEQQNMIIDALVNRLAELGDTGTIDTELERVDEIFNELYGN